MGQNRLQIHSMVADLVAVPDRLERGLYRFVRTVDQCLQHGVDLYHSEEQMIEKLWKELFKKEGR